VSAPLFLNEAMQTFLRIQDTVLGAEQSRAVYDQRIKGIVERRAIAFKAFADQTISVMPHLIGPDQPQAFTDAMEAIVRAWRETAEFELDQRAQEWGIYHAISKEIGGFHDRVKAIQAEAQAKAAATTAAIQGHDIPNV